MSYIIIIYRWLLYGINDRFDEQFTLMSIPRMEKFYTTILSVTLPGYN